MAADNRFSLHTHLKDLHASRHAKSDSASTASGSLSTDSSDEQHRHIHHHVHHDRHPHHIHHHHHSSEGTPPKKSVQQKPDGKSPNSFSGSGSGSGSGSRSSAGSGTGTSGSSSNSGSRNSGNRMSHAGEQQGHGVDKDKATSSAATLATAGGDTAASLAPFAIAEESIVSTRQSMRPRGGSHQQQQGQEGQPLVPIAIEETSISTLRQSNSPIAGRGSQRSNGQSLKPIAIAGESIINTTKHQSVSKAKEVVSSSFDSKSVKKLNAMPEKPKPKQKGQKVKEVSSSEEETSDEEDTHQNWPHQQQQRMGQMHHRGMGQPQMMRGYPGQSQYPYHGQQQQQQMYQQQQQQQMAQIGMMPMRSMAFDAPFVPLRSEIPPNLPPEECSSDDDSDDPNCCCEEDLEDGVEFSYRPKPHCRTEVTFTIEPKKQPQWLTMMNCGFRPVVNCTAPPCYLTPSNNPGMNVCGGSMVNNAYCQPFSQPNYHKPLPTIQQLQKSLRGQRSKGDAGKSNLPKKRVSVSKASVSLAASPVSQVTPISTNGASTSDDTASSNLF